VVTHHPENCLHDTKARYSHYLSLYCDPSDPSMNWLMTVVAHAHDLRVVIIAPTKI